MLHFSLKHPISCIMIYSGLLVLSLFISRNIKLDFYPKMEARKILIETEFYNADASTVREMVTIPLENACLLLQDHKAISSISKDGKSTIQVECHYGTDMELAFLKAKETVDSAYNSLPYGCKKSTVKIAEDPDNCFVFSFEKISGVDHNAFLEKILIPDLLRIKGVYEVDFYGNDEKDIQIQLNKEKLEQRKLTLREVADACNLSNCDFPVGTITEGSDLHQVKVNGKINDYRDFENIILSHDLNGGTLRIKDLGNVECKNRDRKNFASFDGKDCVLVKIKINNEENPLKTSKKIKEQLKLLQNMNEGLYSFSIIQDSTEVLLKEIKKLAIQGAAGMTITFLCLLFFFRSTVLASAITLTVPLCIVFSIAILTITGNSLNIISLSGLTIGIGLIVDCSSVVAVQIVNASDIEKSARTIKLSNLGSTATTIISFVPVFFINGPIKEMFSCLSVAIICCIVFSYAASTSITVSLFILMRKQGKDFKVLNLTGIEERLKKSLLKLKEKPLLAILMVTSVLLLGIFAFSDLTFVMNAARKTDYARIIIPFPSNVTADYIQKKSIDIYEEMKSIPNLKGVLMTGGTIKESEELSEEHFYDNGLEIELFFNTMNISEIEKELKGKLKMENCKISCSKNKIDIINNYPLGFHYIQGESLYDLENKMLILKNNFNFDFSPNEKNAEWEFIPSIEKLSKCGISSEYLSGYITDYVEGISINPIKENGFERSVKVMFKNQGQNITDLVNHINVFIDEKPIPVSGFGTISSKVKDVAYYREGRKDAMLVKLKEDTDLHKFKEEIIDRRKTDASLMIRAFSMLIALVFCLIYFFIGMLFESYRIPLIVSLFMLSAVPGAAIGLKVFNYSFDFNAMVSFVILLGLSANNTILILEKLVKESSVTVNSAINICCKLVSTLLITNGTTIFSLVPFVLTSSIAVSVIGGLLSSLILNLILIPLFLPKWKILHA